MTVVIDASELLDAWEAGWNRTPLERGLAMLAAGTGRSAAELADLSIGQRDRTLFDLRAALFGATVDAVSRCPRCGTDVEVTFNQDDLLGSSQSAPTAAVVDGATYRLPTSADVAAVLADSDPRSAAVALVHRCAVTTAEGSAPAPSSAAAEIADTDVDAVVAAWSATDPVLDVELGMSCPGCEQAWSEPFDIVSYLWSELDSWCRRALLEVHDLASAYGWSEPQVLALSAWRRQCYLGLVAS